MALLHRPGFKKPAACAAALWLASALALTAQQPQLPSTKPPTEPKDRAIRVNVDLVLVPATVMDPYGRLVTGLEKDNFRIYEDLVEQEIQYLSTQEVPISVGVIYDRSGSMGPLVDLANNSAAQFFRTANPGDEFFLIVFNQKTQLASDFTSEYGPLQTRLFATEAGGSTALLDAVYLGLAQMKKAKHSRRALIVISDGLDNSSRYNTKDIEAALRESDTQIYAIGGRQTVLEHLAEISGGRTFGMGSRYGREDTTAERIWVELRIQYVLGYRSSNAARDGKWRKIQVKLRPIRGLPPLQLFAKRGYYAPSQ